MRTNAWIARGNIELFQAKLKVEEDPDKRRILNELLAKEREMLANVPSKEC